MATENQKIGYRGIPRGGRKKGSIELILGPMFSGKSTELMRRLKRYQVHIFFISAKNLSFIHSRQKNDFDTYIRRLLSIK